MSERLEVGPLRIETSFNGKGKTIVISVTGDFRNPVVAKVLDDLALFATYLKEENFPHLVQKRKRGNDEREPDAIVFGLTNISP